jgi:hypothetical protein
MSTLHGRRIKFKLDGAIPKTIICYRLPVRGANIPVCGWRSYWRTGKGDAWSSYRLLIELETSCRPVDSCRSCMASSLFRIVLTLQVEIDDRMLYDIYTVSFLFRYTDQSMGLRICLHVSSLYTAQQQRQIELILGQWWCRHGLHGTSACWKFAWDVLIQNVRNLEMLQQIGLPPFIASLADDTQKCCIRPFTVLWYGPDSNFNWSPAA